MKSIKKLISVILAGLMLSNICVVNATEDDGQIVSLQFALDGTITDEYNHPVVKCEGKKAIYTPEEMTSIRGNRVVLTTTGVIEVDVQKLLGSDESVFDESVFDEFTFETWIKINDESTERRLFAIRDMDETSSMSEVVYSYTSSSNTAVLKNRLGTKEDSSNDTARWIEHPTDDIYPYKNTWKHYTFTRKWDSENSKWTTKTYIDGVLDNSAEESGVRLENKEEGDNYCKLYIGSNTSKLGNLTKGLACSYGAVNVYKKELSAERIAQLYLDTKDGFVIPSNNMDVENITPAEGDISHDVGKITLKFSNYIDPATVSGNIVFSKENGGTVEGWSTSVRDEFFVDITIPELEHREKYKVTVKPGLKSINEVAAIEKEYIFTAKDSSRLIDADFMGDEFVVGQASPEISGIRFRSGHIYNSSANIKVGQTESGTKYLRLSPVELSKSEAIDIMFDNLTEGCPVIEFKVRRGGADEVEPRMGMLNNTNGTYLGTIGKDYADADKDADGFATYKVIICKSESGFYQYKLYYTVNGRKVMKTINLDSKEISSITSYNVAQFYQSEGTISSDNYVDIAYIGHYITAEPDEPDIPDDPNEPEEPDEPDVPDVPVDPSVPITDMIVKSVTPREGDIAHDAGKITLKFSNFIEPATVPGNIVFSKENGGEVQGWSTSVRDDFYVDITIPELKHKEKYKVTVKSGLKSTNDIAATEKEYIFTAIDTRVTIDADFMGDEFVVGQSSPAIEGIRFRSGHAYNSTANIKVGQTESGTKYLRLSPVELSKSEAIDITFNSLTEGCPVIEFKVRRGGDQSVEPRMGMLNNKNGTYLGVIGKEYADADKDADGFASYKVIICKSENGFYQYKLYYTVNGKKVMKVINFDDKEISSITSYNVAQFYQSEGTISPDNYVDIAYIGHYITDEPDEPDYSEEPDEPEDPNLPLLPTNDMIVKTVRPAEGDISHDAGKITLKFSNFIDSSTVPDNIVFSKENGEAVEGWSTSVRDDFFVDITIPELEHREKYKVTVKSGLKSTNQIAATESEYIFTAKDSRMIIDEDFMGENFVVGQASPAIEGIRFRSGHTYNSSANIKVGQTESGTKYLRLSPVELSKAEVIDIMFDELTEGCPVVEFKVRRGGADEVEPRMGMLNNTNGTYLGTIGKDYADADKDADGFASYKVIICKSESGFYQYKLYYTVNGRKVMKEINLDSKAISSIKSYNVAQFYQSEGTISSDNYVDIAYIGHYITDEPDEPDIPDEPDVPDVPDEPEEPDEPIDPSVPITDMIVKTVRPAEGDISHNAGKITLRFSNYIDPETVNGNIVFSKENGGEVQGWSTSVRDDFYVDITIPELKHREKYKVTVKSGLKSINEIAATESEFIFTAKDSSVIIDEDFMGDEFVVGQASPAIEGIQFRSKHAYNSSTYIKVGQTESGTRYLRLSPVELGKSEAINILFDNLTEGCPVIEFKVRRGGNPDLEPRMGMLNNTNGTYVGTIGTDYADADKDADGFASYKVIICKSENGFYQYKLYYTIDGYKVMKTINLDSKAISSITSYNVAQFYQADGTISPDNYVDIAYIGHYITDEPDEPDYPEEPDYSEEPDEPEDPNLPLVPTNDMIVKTVRPAEGNISYEVGKITLKFSNFIDASTVPDNIVFSKENGEAVEGWSASVRDDFYVDITIPNLEHKEKYKVTVKSGLKSTNGIAATESEYIFTAKDSKMIIDEDFMGDEFVVGEASPAITGIKFTSRHVNHSSENIKVGQDESGTKYLRLSPVEAGKSEAIDITFDNLTEGCPVVEFKVRRGGDSELEPRMGMLNRVNGTYIGIIGKEHAGADKDADGFASYKVMICKSSKEFYQYKLYYTVNGQEVEEVINLDGKEISKITGYNVAQFYQDKGTTSPDNYIDISYIRHYILNEPKVENKNNIFETFNIETDDIVKVEFNEKMKEDSITADTVKLINKETGDTVSWTFVSYDAQTKTASFKIDEAYLEYETEYEIDCAGTMTEAGIENTVSAKTSFTTRPLEVTLSEPSYSKTESGVSLSIPVASTSTESKEVKVIAVLYDNNNRTVQVKNEIVNLTTPGSDTVNMSMDYQDGYTLKIIAVEDDGGNLKPIKKAPIEYRGENPVE